VQPASKKGQSTSEEIAPLVCPTFPVRPRLRLNRNFRVDITFKKRRGFPDVSRKTLAHWSRPASELSRPSESHHHRQQKRRRRRLLFLADRKCLLPLTPALPLPPRRPAAPPWWARPPAAACPCSAGWRCWRRSSTRRSWTWTCCWARSTPTSRTSRTRGARR